MAEVASNDDRDELGRFKPGWRGGPGNPNVRRQGEYQAALHDVVSPQRFRGVLMRLLKAVAEKGDMQAARIIIDRVLGKPRSEPLPEAALVMPEDLRTTADVSKATNALLQAVASGQVSPEDGQRIASIIEAKRKGIETEDLERRITELEVRAKQERRE